MHGPHCSHCMTGHRPTSNSVAILTKTGLQELRAYALVALSNVHCLKFGMKKLQKIVLSLQPSALIFQMSSIMLYFALAFSPMHILSLIPTLPGRMAFKMGSVSEFLICPSLR